MEFELRIESDNDAFAEDPASELADILRDTADRLDTGHVTGDWQTVLDSNGNSVGQFRVRLSNTTIPGPGEDGYALKDEESAAEALERQQ